MFMDWAVKQTWKCPWAYAFITGELLLVTIFNIPTNVINKETFCMLNKNSWTNLKIAVHILGIVRFRGFLLPSTFSLGYIAWDFPELPQMGHRVSLSPHLSLHLFVLTFYCHKKYITNFMILRVSSPYITLWHYLV